MAELIPIEYRLRVAQRQQLAKWAAVAALAAIVAAVGLSAVYGWERKCAYEHDYLNAQYRDKSALITRSEDLRSSRQDLANRMQKIQKLMDDKTLLSLLRNISQGFSQKDCLEYVNIDARADDNGNPTRTEPGEGRYIVRITGITENSTSLADLMTRLGKNANPPVNVVLQSSRREQVLDGQVMRFEIVCQQPDSKGT